MNRNLVFIALSLLTWGFGEGLFFNFQPIYLKELGSDAQPIGLILGGYVILFPTRLFASILVGMQDMAVATAAQAAGWAVTTATTVGLVLAGCGLYALVIAWACVIGIATFPLYLKIRCRLKCNEVMSAVIMTTLSVLTVVIPMVGLGFLVTQEVIAAYHFITTLTDVFGFFSFLGLATWFLGYLRLTG